VKKREKVAVVFDFDFVHVADVDVDVDADAVVYLVNYYCDYCCCCLN